MLIYNISMNNKSFYSILHNVNYNETCHFNKKEGLTILKTSIDQQSSNTYTSIDHFFFKFNYSSNPQIL
jgi:hypothetical protein